MGVTVFVNNLRIQPSMINWMKKYTVYTGLFLFLFVSRSYSQDTIYNYFETLVQDLPVQTAPQRHKIAVFAPLYLDSAFDATLSYRHGNSFPKYINPGLEFYEGAELAIDSLEKEGIPLEIFVYDSRSTASSVATVIRQGKLEDMQLIIGHVNSSEARAIANVAARKNIPFINVNYPNDAGVTNNPNYVILNSTLQTHCAAIYRFIQTHYALSEVVMFLKKGQQEETLKNYFEEISRRTASVPLKIKFVTLEANFVPLDLRRHMKAGATTVCIAGSLDTRFGSLLTQQLASLTPSHPSVIFGMPTWWDVTDFSGSEYRGAEVIFTTPFYIDTARQTVNTVLETFKSNFYSKPTDMLFRGYETLYHFARLLHFYGDNLGSGLTDKRFSLFNEYNIQPVIGSRSNTLDYFENKHIYFVKKIDGTVVAVY